MKKLIFTLSLLITAYSVFSKTKFVDVYRSEKGAYKSIRVPMFFDTDSITIRKQKVDLGNIYRIDYVATSYGNKVTPYQKYLNKKRWTALNNFVDLPVGGYYEMNSIYQTKAKSVEEAEKLFHGYIIYYGVSAEKAHKKSTNSIHSLMNKLCQAAVTSATRSVYIPRASRVDSTWMGDVSVKDKRNIDRRLVKNNHVIEWGYDSLGVDRKYHGAYYILTKVSVGIFVAFKSLADKTLFDMLQRSKITDKTLIVTDLTGSMYPYYSQLLVWNALKMSQGKKLKHVFFNDGDAKRTEDKRIGSTGGVYISSSNNVLTVYKRMNQCMQGGFGGDGPENNFEAVKVGLKKFENIDNVIMLADNWAVPRDTVLLNNIDKPINFVMCGTFFGLNPEYLTLAKQNGGQITTVENSLSDILQSIMEGDEIRVNKKKYGYKKGRFNLKS